MGVEPASWQGRRVLVTGHTGFKGAWLSLWLQSMGADVLGLSDSVPTEPSLFELAGIGKGMRDERVDVRDADGVDRAFAGFRPETVIHMAAQSLVRPSFADPRATYATNVMGTVNVLEAVRATPGVEVVVNVTSDKCYDNREQGRPFVEDDCKGGHDPYSSSKGCAELVADAYLRSFFESDAGGPRLGSARAGNVIGGGDWGQDRLIPDIARAALAGETVKIRNPSAVRPWQHVLNPLSGYLQLAQALAEDGGFQGGWNFGPAQGDVRSVSWIAERLGERWAGGLRWEPDAGPHPHEAHYLALDSTKARKRLGWEPGWGLEPALDSIATWYGQLGEGGDMRAATLAQVDAFTGRS